MTLNQQNNYITPDDIYKESLKRLGEKVTLYGLNGPQTPQELGCAETISDILFVAGCQIDEFYSTTLLNHFLANNDNWVRILTLPDRGDVIISPTGSGGKNGITHGHCGIVMDGVNIASNDSATGKFLVNWTLTKWRSHYANLGGYPVLVYRKIAAPKPAESVVMTAEETQVVEQAVQVAQKAVVYPSLWAPMQALLSFLFGFLATKK